MNGELKDTYISNLLKRISNKENESNPDRIKIVDYNNLVPDRNNEKWFFGEYSGVQRFDYIFYPFTEKLTLLQLQQFWMPNEIALHEDRKNFLELSPENQEHIKLNLTFQTLMDSSQEAGLGLALAPAITAPSLLQCIRTQEFFELIHSMSYSHIVREMFDSPTYLFDTYFKEEKIKYRTKDEIDLYEDFMVKHNDSSDENKLRLLKLCYRIQLLEGVKFYVSFLTTYIINKYAGRGNLIPNIAKTIKLIHQDESLHLMIFSYIIRTLRKDQSQGFTDLFTPEVEEMFRQESMKVYEDELDWARYLLSVGNLAVS